MSRRRAAPTLRRYSLSPVRWRRRATDTSAHGTDSVPSLRKVNSTSAKPTGFRDAEPWKIRSSMRWPRSDFALCSPSAQRTDSEMLLFPHPFGPTMAVMPGVTFRTVFSANDLKPCSATDSRRMGFLSTGDPLRPKKKAPAVGVLPRQSAKYRPSSCLEVVTFLVLLAGAAEAGVVTPDFFPGRRARSRLGARRGHGRARGLARQLAAGFTRIRPPRHPG